MLKGFEPLYAALKTSPEYKRLEETLEAGKGPVGVFGLGEAHRANVTAALAASHSGATLVIVPSAQAAQRVHEELSCY
ncbi:MAG: hypothetical protein II191_00565, partial [Clostridia bacterium]|nr:hypothetical protein [Clostridia bacterium]